MQIEQFGMTLRSFKLRRTRRKNSPQPVRTGCGGCGARPIALRIVVGSGTSVGEAKCSWDSQSFNSVSLLKQLFRCPKCKKLRILQGEEPTAPRTSEGEAIPHSWILDYKNALTNDPCRVPALPAMSGNADIPRDARAGRGLLSIFRHGNPRGITFVTPSSAFETDGHGVERKRAQKVAPHSLLHLHQRTGSSVNPFHRNALRQLLRSGSRSRLRIRLACRRPSAAGLQPGCRAPAAGRWSFPVHRPRRGRFP